MRTEDTQTYTPEGSDEPEWVRKHAQEEKRNRILRERAELEARLVKIREKEQRDKQRAEQETRNPKKQVRRVHYSTCEEKSAKWTSEADRGDDRWRGR